MARGIFRFLTDGRLPAGAHNTIAGLDTVVRGLYFDITMLLFAAEAGPQAGEAAPQLLEALLPQPPGPRPRLLGLGEQARRGVALAIPARVVRMRQAGPCIVIHGGGFILDLEDGGEGGHHVVLVRVLVTVLLHTRLLKTFKSGVFGGFFDKISTADIFMLSFKLHFNFLSYVPAIGLDLFMAFKSCFCLFISPRFMEGTVGGFLFFKSVNKVYFILAARRGVCWRIGQRVEGGAVGGVGGRAGGGRQGGLTLLVKGGVIVLKF